MIASAFTKRPSTQTSYIEPSFSRPALTKLTYTEIPQPKAPPVPDHAPRMCLSAQINSLGTHIEELAVVSDTRFYSMEDRMDKYQTRFIS